MIYIIFLSIFLAIFIFSFYHWVLCVREDDMEYAMRWNMIMCAASLLLSIINLFIRIVGVM
jgi:hypothetical protein